MPTIKEIREKRLKAVSDARAISEAAGKEKREMTQEESKRFDDFMAESDKLKAEIAGLEAGEERSKRLAAAEEELRKSPGRQTEPTDPGRDDEEDDHEDEGRGRRGQRRGTLESRFAQKDKDFRFEVRAGTTRGVKRPGEFVCAAGSAEHRRHTPEYRRAFQGYLAGHEQRALQTDLDTAGGYIVAPEQFVAELLKNVDDEVFMRQLARAFTTGAQSIGVPSRTAKLSSFAWGSELGAPTADTALKFGKRALSPHYMTGSILVSRDLLRSALMDVEAIVLEELSRDSGELEEQAFMTGHGAGRPLGIFTASSDGVSTSRDVSTDNTTTAITADGLINAKFSLKPKYRSRATWLFHTDAVKNIMKLKDSANQYLWQPSIQAGTPDKILNLPYVESYWVPNTFTTGLYVGALADFSYYWIVDNLTLELQRLVETRASTNQVEFIARRKVDGAPTIEEAFARVKLG